MSQQASPGLYAGIVNRPVDDVASVGREDRTVNAGNVPIEICLADVERWSQPLQERIRYYGFLANRYREEKLARCRELLDMPAPEPPALEGAKDYREPYQELIGPSFGECPACHQGRMLVIEILAAKPT
jgi:hypothetical protein